ncbi:hypothetical protein ACM26V_14865 [Salipaludibacillus sp. HK11]|uniref:hypothetical protein n=1 Tax=Salipaludibacillus sp. HK11 TaxID=3394320 RepID=UPI0039FB8A6A
MINRFEMKADVKINRDATSSFVSPFSSLEKIKMVDLFSEANGVRAFNGKSVRLDRIRNRGDVTCVDIAIVDFFDFISTTLVYYQRDALIDYCESHDKCDELELIKKLIRSMNEIGSHSSFQDIIHKKELSNILAVSVLIEDVNGDVGVIHRSEKVAVSSGIFSVSATGALDEIDYYADNPIMSCAKREVEEELNIRGDALVFDELVMSKQKLQPVALLSLKLEQSWKDIISSIKSAEDFHKETQKIYAVPSARLVDFLGTETFTEVATYQLRKKYFDEGDGNDEKGPNNFCFDKDDYLL